jgi:FkbM family methyltransferase
MKILRGIAILENDTHISKWVAESGRLDHDQNMLPLLAEFIKEGETVIDVGAYIGDHTCHYSRLVGEAGKVIAIEANTSAFDCLVYNMANYANVINHNVAVGDKSGEVSIQEPNDNKGMAFAQPGKGVPIVTIDSLSIKPNFIKFDIEGYEYKALVGAAETIKTHAPTMLIEINKPALARNNVTFENVADLLRIWGYSFRNIYKEQGFSDIQFDIICWKN